MKIVLTVLLIIGIADALMVWACLRVGAEADRRMEEDQKEMR